MEGTARTPPRRPRTTTLPRLVLKAPDALLEAVRKYAEWGHDPLGARGACGARAAVEGALGGLGAHADEAYANYVAVRGQEVTAFDMTAARLAARLGIDPLALAWLHAFAHQTMTVVTGRDDMTLALSGDDDTIGHVDLGRGATWWLDGMVTVPWRLGDAVCASLGGRRLRDVVGHEELDQHDLVIASAQAGREETAIRLEPHTSPATADRLLALSFDVSAARTHRDQR